MSPVPEAMLQPQFVRSPITPSGRTGFCPVPQNSLSSFNVGHSELSHLADFSAITVTLIRNCTALLILTTWRMTPCGAHANFLRVISYANVIHKWRYGSTYS